MLKNILNVIFIAALLAGCGTPSAVKKLSQEQVVVQQSFAESLEKYMRVVSAFAEAQVELANHQIEDIRTELEQKYQKRAELKILAKPDDKQEIKTSLKDLTASVTQDLKNAELQKARIIENLDRLKTTQSAIQKSFKSIQEAQSKLNEYLQLEKSDEALLNQVTGKIGINMENLKRSVDESLNIAENIKEIIKNL